MRGETSEGHELEPVLLADGVTFVLPEAVLTDPAHAERHELLATFPTRDVAAGEYPPPDET
ncbi:hypothetical protein [Faunimonas pinastri]|uniref:hypothetical protein n=1 Tax=Faunimonas pinastri TaxID=1855383 RepID=UPI00115F7EE7|nr:hypothetical protein [Faunimonas pinastri]